MFGAKRLERLHDLTSRTRKLELVAELKKRINPLAVRILADLRQELARLRLNLRVNLLRERCGPPFLGLLDLEASPSLDRRDRVAVGALLLPRFRECDQSRRVI